MAVSTTYRIPVPVCTMAAVRLLGTDPDLGRELVEAIAKASFRDERGWAKYLEREVEKAREEGFDGNLRSMLMFAWTAILAGVERFGFADPENPALHLALTAEYLFGRINAQVVSPAELFAEENLTLLPSQPAFGNCNDNDFLDTIARQPEVELVTTCTSPALKVTFAFDPKLVCLPDCSEAPALCTVTAYSPGEKGKPVATPVCSANASLEGEYSIVFTPSSKDMLAFSAAVANQSVVRIDFPFPGRKEDFGMVFRMPGYGAGPAPVWCAVPDLVWPLGRTDKMPKSVILAKGIATKCLEKIWWLSCGRDFMAAHLAKQRGR